MKCVIFETINLIGCGSFVFRLLIVLITPSIIINSNKYCSNTNETLDDFRIFPHYRFKYSFNEFLCPRVFSKSETFLMGIIVAAMTAPFDGAIFVMGGEYLNSLGPAELYAAIEN